MESIVHVRPDIRVDETHVEANQWLMDPSLLAKCRVLIIDITATSRTVDQGVPKIFELLHLANMTIKKNLYTLTPVSKRSRSAVCKRTIVAIP